MKSAMILNVHALEQEGLPTTPFNNRSGRYLPRFRTCHVICHNSKTLLRYWWYSTAVEAIAGESVDGDRRT